MMRADGKADSERAFARVLLVAAIAIVLGALAIRFADLWPQRWAQDDAYVSFRYARNFVRGLGLVYNPGARVEGYSNFLWTMLSAVPLALGATDPLAFMHVAGILLWAASYLLLLGLTRMLWIEGFWIAPLAALPLAFHGSFNLWFLSGMETPLVSALTIAAVVALSADAERHPSAPALASLCGVLLAMTRPDGIVSLGALVLAGGLVHGTALLAGRDWRRYLVAPLVPVVAILLPYELWRIAYYGSFYPNTYYTRVAYLTYYARGWEYLRTYLSTYHLLPYLPIALLGALAARPGVARRFLRTAVVVSAFAALYVVRLGGDFMEWRFLVPASGVLYPAIIVGACALGARLFSPLVAAVGATVVAVALTASTIAGSAAAEHTAIDGQETIALLRRYADPGQFDWRLVARLLDEVLPRNAVIATTAAGIIPYYTDRRCLDLHGLTDPEIAREPVDPSARGRMGHEHWLRDYGAIRARGADVVIEWPEGVIEARSLVTPPRPDREKVSVRLPDSRYVDFTILNPAAFDRAALERDRRVVLYGSRPDADKHALYALRAALSELTVVDRLDVGDPTSEVAHAFDLGNRTGTDADTAHLFNRRPFSEVSLADDGRRIESAIAWDVHGVSPAAGLVVVGRYDRTDAGSYEVSVNGRTLPVQLEVAGGRAIWDEARIDIPAPLLAEGTNRFEMRPAAGTHPRVRWSYFWFLQSASLTPIPSRG